MPLSLSLKVKQKNEDDGPVECHNIPWPNMSPGLLMQYILCLHGVGGDLDSMLDVTEYLWDRKDRIILLKGQSTC